MKGFQTNINTINIHAINNMSYLCHAKTNIVLLHNIATMFVGSLYDDEYKYIYLQTYNVCKLLKRNCKITYKPI